MNQLPVLIKREFWENRTAFLIVPAIISGFLILVMLFALTAGKTDVIHVDIDGDWDSDWHEEHGLEIRADREEIDDVFEMLLYRLEGASEMQREEYIRSGLKGLSVSLFITLWFVIAIYMLDTLYQDRRDRSILFWKSMPVSDGLTIASKLITGLLLVPLIYVAAVMVLQLAALLILTLGSLGTEVSALEIIWGPSGVIGIWFQYLGVLVFHSAWSLPFFAWLLVVSAYAKSVPLVWAAGVPLAIGIIESLFTSQHGLWNWMKLHTVPVQFLGGPDPLSEIIADEVLSLQMASAIVVGLALVFLSIWLRGRADEI